MRPANRTNQFTVLAALVVFLPLLAMLAWSFGRGLDLTDEAIYIYLYAHPRTVAPIMDHFVWGTLLHPFSWTIVDLRYLTAALLLASTLLLCIATRRHLRAHTQPPDTVLLFVLPVLGSLLYFTGVRPTLSYSTTLVVCSNVFFAALLGMHGGNRVFGRLILILLMGTMVAWCWLARLSVCVPMLVMAVLWQVSERHARWNAVGLRFLAIIGVAAGLLGVLWSLGCDLAGQLHLLEALTRSSHAPLVVIAGDAAYGAAILAMASVVAAISGQLRLRLTERRCQNLHVLLLGVVAASAVLAMWLHRDFVMMPLAGVLRFNPPLRSLGPAIHVLAFALLMFHAATLAAVRWPLLRAFVPPEPDSERAAAILRVAILLYAASLVPEVGTNTGIWHRSVLSMGPLFLMAALFAPGADDGKAWRAPVLLLATAIPISAALVSNTVTRPFRVDGSMFAQTERLDHPAALRGLKVAPTLADAQAELDRAFADIHRRPSAAPAIYGYGRPGLAVLAGAPILGAPWYLIAYPNSAEWNCALARFAVRENPPLIVGIDVAQLGPGLEDCLPQYVFGPPAARAGRFAISLLVRRP